MPRSTYSLALSLWRATGAALDALCWWHDMAGNFIHNNLYGQE